MSKPTQRECIAGIDPASGPDQSIVMMARTTQLKIYRDILTRRIVFEVVEYDLILQKNIRAAREVVGDMMESTMNLDIKTNNNAFLRYMVEKFEQRLLFQLGLEELPL